MLSRFGRECLRGRMELVAFDRDGETPAAAQRTSVRALAGEALGSIASGVKRSSATAVVTITPMASAGLRLNAERLDEETSDERGFWDDYLSRFHKALRMLKTFQGSKPRGTQ
jgi:hypothetical protein